MSSIADQLKFLVNLQEIDLQILNLQKQKDVFPDEMKSLDQALMVATKTLGDRRGSAEGHEKVVRQAKAAMELNEDRMVRAKAKMEDVSNPQMFSAAKKEIDQLNKLNEELTEQSKGAEAELKKLDEATKGLQEKFEEAKKARDEKAAEVEKKSSELDSKIAKLMASRDAEKKKVSPAHLSRYDRIRNARAGVGIVPAVGGQCKGCNIMIPPQQFNELRRSPDLAQCPSCSRIVYIPETPAAEGDDADKAAG